MQRNKVLFLVVLGVAASLSLTSPLTAMAASDKPIANNDSLVVPDHPSYIYWYALGHDVSLLGNDLDANGGVLTPALVSPPAHGAILDFGAGMQYIPEAGYLGPDSFTYRLRDPEDHKSNLATVTLSVVPNRAPIAVADDYSTVSGETLIVPVDQGVLRNDTDPDEGDTSRAPESALTLPTHGILIPDGMSGGSFSYTPDSGYVGKDQFSYRAADSYGALGAPVLVVIDVTPVVAELVVTKVPSGPAGTKVALTAQILSASTSMAGAPIAVFVDGLKLASGLTDADGVADILIPLPLKVGTLPLTVVSGAVMRTETLTVSPGLPAVTSLSMKVPSTKPGRNIELATRISSGNPFKADAVLTVYLDGKEVTRGSTDHTGAAKLPVTLPSLAGKHSIAVVAGAKSAVTNFDYGTGVTARLSALKTVTAQKVQTIKGSFGDTAGTITLKITEPAGTTVSETVKLSSTGEFSYKYRTSSAKGSYTVRYYYNADAKHYGAKSYKASFEAR